MNTRHLILVMLRLHLRDIPIDVEFRPAPHATSDALKYATVFLGGRLDGS